VAQAAERPILRAGLFVIAGNLALPAGGWQQTG
jgi:hypothetical protein